MEGAMNNEIVTRQNEEKAIEYLAAQRQIYSEAKKLDNIGIIFSVILPLVLSIMQLFFKENIFWSLSSKILSIVSMFVGMAVGSFVKKGKNVAAMIQQMFDVYVYQMPWDNKLFGKEKNLSYLIAEKSKILLDKAGERDKLMNWYTGCVGEGVSNIKGIWMCQKENFNWDVNLRKKYKKSCSIIVGVLIVGILLAGLVNDESIIVLISRFAFILPMLKWLFPMIKQLNDDIRNMQEIDELINDSEEKTMDDLQEIQNKLYVHRKSCYAIPDFFYNRYKDNDEDLAYRTAKLDKLAEEKRD